LLREFGRRYLFAHMQITKVVIMTVAGGTAQLSALCALAYGGRLSAATALFAIGIGSGISGLGWLWLSRDAFQFSPRSWSYFAHKNWVAGRSLLAYQGIGHLAQGIMPWLVWFWLGPVATGLFAACETIIRLANPVVTSLVNVLTPRMALGLHDGGKAELNRIVWKATALLTFYLFAFCILLALVGEWFLTRSFGNSYVGFSATLVVMGIQQLVGRFGLGLAPSGALWLLQRANCILMAVGANLVVCLIVAPLLLPHYAILGAALALLAGSLANSAASVGFYLAEMRSGKEEGFVAVCPAISSAAPAGSVSE
jgi:O-antigen/teichoic acid export membrane protein